MCPHVVSTSWWILRRQRAGQIVVGRNIEFVDNDRNRWRKCELQDCHQRIDYRDGRLQLHPFSGRSSRDKHVVDGLARAGSRDFHGAQQQRQGFELIHPTRAPKDSGYFSNDSVSLIGVGSGFFDKALLSFLEERAIPYIVVARLTAEIKRRLHGIHDWQELDGGAYAVACFQTRLARLLRGGRWRQPRSAGRKPRPR